MNTANFDEALEQITQKDPRYHRDAYLFVREALDHTQKLVSKTGKGDARQSGDEEAEPKVRHVSGQELLEGIRAYALEQFGPMTLTVLSEWGVNRCEDFGEIVFNMVENHLLAKTKKDSREDFKGGYSFIAAFQQPFLPKERQPTTPSEPKPTEA